jgi:hypothetical protein
VALELQPDQSCLLLAHFLQRARHKTPLLILDLSQSSLAANLIRRQIAAEPAGRKNITWCYVAEPANLAEFEEAIATPPGDDANAARYNVIVLGAESFIRQQRDTARFLRGIERLETQGCRVVVACEGTQSGRTDNTVLASQAPQRLRAITHPSEGRLQFKVLRKSAQRDASQPSAQAQLPAGSTKHADENDLLVPLPVLSFDDFFQKIDA